MSVLGSTATRSLIRLSHSERWLGVLNLLCVIGLCSVSAALLLDLCQDAARQAEITSRSQVQLLGRDIARNVELYDLALRDVVSRMERPDVLGLSPELRQRELFNHSVDAEGFGRILVMDTNGNAIASSRSFPPTPNGATRDFIRYFLNHRDDGLHIGPPTVSPSVDGKWSS